jgi:hypothetical protein
MHDIESIHYSVACVCDLEAEQYCWEYRFLHTYADTETQRKSNAEVWRESRPLLLSAMSLATVLGRASLCSRAALAPARIHVPLGTATRVFSTTPVAQLRKEPKPRAPLSKKAQAAKARKRASKARKNIYENEKMPLADAISILRVRCLRSPRHAEHMRTHART